MNKLMLTLALVLLPSIVLGDVVSGSLHSTDMSILDTAMAMEYSNVDVSCVEADGIIHIGIYFDCPWTGSDYNYGQLGTAVGAGGAFTSLTSWHSDYLMMLFTNDKSAGCTTRAAREFAINVAHWSNAQIGNWILNNLTLIDN